MKMDTSEVDGLSSASPDRCTAANTPDSKELHKGNSVLKTPVSGMSSSLKERLKKCGRYHPATPLSSRQSTPTTSSLFRTPASSPSTPGTSSSKQENTPTRHHPDSNSMTECSSTHRRRTLPQPRNILKEKCVLSNHMEGESKNLNSSELTLGYKTCLTVDNKGKGRQCDSSNTQVGVCSGDENPDSRPQSEGSPVIHTSSVTDSDCEQVAPVKYENKSSLDKEDEVQELSAVASNVDWREKKKKLNAELAERKEVLRKLRMVKTYRAKHDLMELQGLIDKWRSTCQQAVLDLHELTPDPRPSLTQLVCQLGIDQELVRYNAEDECFEED